VLPVPVTADQAAIRDVALQRDVEFSEYTPLASFAEVVARLISPLHGEELKRKLAQSGYPENGQSIDLRRERFSVYVPAVEPPLGFAVLVFVPPWEDARLPLDWNSILERSGTILVTMEHAGNRESVLDRRVPLALLAAHNVMARYHVDKQRVYVGGFSGGSRVAMRIALGYPDVFRGALLNAGSDPIGDSQTPLPPEALFRIFQTSSRLLYFTGQDDAVNLEKDSASSQSLRRWCVFNTESQAIFRQGHDVAPAAALQRALLAVSKPLDENSGRFASCRMKLADDLSLRLQRVDAAVAGRKPRDARKQLDAIDAQFGGMAAPRSIELDRQIETLTKDSSH
jgi:dienelactone hydrolase